MKKRESTPRRKPDRISAVAAMTNLLAMNTMLEAARLGADGKGFATVADELTEITRKTNQSFTQGNIFGKKKVALDSADLDTVMHDQLEAMQDLNSSLSSITRLAAEVTKAQGHKSIPEKELHHLYEILGNNSGKDIA